MMTSNQLPDIISLEDFAGDFNLFYEAVYTIFKRDFVKNKPIFRGKKLGLKKYPERDGKESTFYHMVSDGPIEADRLPDLRRGERISWAKPTIENCDSWSLKVWPQIRKGRNRICIMLEIEDGNDYIVILEVREKYILPWTTYNINYKHEKKKKLKEYNEYLKCKSRQNLDGSVTPSTHG